MSESVRLKREKREKDREKELEKREIDRQMREERESCFKTVNENTRNKYSIMMILKLNLWNIMCSKKFEATAMDVCRSLYPLLIDDRLSYIVLK